jgi:hypothetical protein
MTLLLQYDHLMCLKIKPFPICEKLDMINKTAEDLGIPVRKVSDKKLGQLDRCR